MMNPKIEIMIPDSSNLNQSIPSNLILKVLNY